MAKRIHVGNLSFETNASTIKEAFALIGPVTDVQVVTDRETGRPRGFAFVEMSTDDDARRALTELNGRELDGRAISVNEARERQPAGGGFGFGRGSSGHRGP